MSNQDLTNFIWQIADLLRGPYRPPQYERVMLPLVVLRRFDCVLAKTKPKVLAEYSRRKGGKLSEEALDALLNRAAGKEFRFHNHCDFDFAFLKSDPDHIDQHLQRYINGFSANVRKIFEFFEFTAEIERMRTLMENTLSKHTGKDPEQIRKDTDRDKILTAEQAVEYGLIDRVLEYRKLSAQK